MAISSCLLAQEPIECQSPGFVQKRLSSKATAKVERGAYTQYVSTNAAKLISKSHTVVARTPLAAFFNKPKN